MTATGLPPLTHTELKRIRLELALEPAQMAERIGIGRSHYVDLERGVALLGPLLQNAIRWVEHSRGGVLSDTCARCDGRGMIRPEPPPGAKRLMPRVRCPACDGCGLEPAREVAA